MIIQNGESGQNKHLHSERILWGKFRLFKLGISNKLTVSRSFSKGGGERGRERQTDRQTEEERDREGETDRQRKRGGGTDRQREREGEGRRERILKRRDDRDGNHFLFL